MAYNALVSNYILQKPWDLISYPCLIYLLLMPNPSYFIEELSLKNNHDNIADMVWCAWNMQGHHLCPMYFCPRCWQMVFMCMSLSWLAQCLQRQNLQDNEEVDLAYLNSFRPWEMWLWHRIFDFQTQFSYWYLGRFFSGNCPNRSLLMVSQQWFRLWLGAVRQQACHYLSHCWPRLLLP